MEQPKDEVYAYFWITDFDCNSSEITQLVGFEPTKAGNKGDKTHRGISERGYWDLYSPLPRSALLIDHHLAILVEMLEPKQETLRNLRNLGYKMGINCVGYFTGNPGFHLSADLIAKCADLSLSVDFDLYCLTDDES